jgi:hypothetical protein
MAAVFALIASPTNSPMGLSHEACAYVTTATSQPASNRPTCSSERTPITWPTWRARDVRRIGTTPSDSLEENSTTLGHIQRSLRVETEMGRVCIQNDWHEGKKTELGFILNAFFAARITATQN